MSPFFMAGGGTGGHVIPALAVARELRARGHEVFFVGTERGMEAKLVPAEGFELQRIDIGGLNRVGLATRLSTLAQACRSPRSAAARFVERRGGGLQHGRICRRASGDGGAAAAHAGGRDGAERHSRVHQPRHRPASSPARSSRFRRPRRYFPAGRTEITGLPVREEFFRIPPKPRGRALNVLITGGSQGSRTLNQAARAELAAVPQAGIAGPHRAPDRRAGIRTNCAPTSRSRASRAKLCLSSPTCRRRSPRPTWWSAAPARARSRNWRRPASRPILVPFPFAADDHQTRNAEAMERGGAARLVRDAGDERREACSRWCQELARRQPGELEAMAQAAAAASPSRARAARGATFWRRWLRG